MKIKYEFADGTVSEVEVEESISAVIIEETLLASMEGDRRVYDAFHRLSKVQQRRLLKLAGGCQSGRSRGRKVRISGPCMSQ